MSDFTITLISIASVVFLVFLAFIIRLIKDNIKIDELKELYLQMNDRIFELSDKISELGYYEEDDEEESIDDYFDKRY